jgi:hypothetical protein
MRRPWTSLWYVWTDLICCEIHRLCNTTAAVQKLRSNWSSNLVFNISVCTFRKTHCISVTNIDLVMFAEIVAVSCKNGTNRVNALFRFLFHRKRHIAITKFSLWMCRETHSLLWESNGTHESTVSIPTTQKTHHIPVTKITRLMFGEEICVFLRNHAIQMVVKADGLPES